MQLKLEKNLSNCKNGGFVEGRDHLPSLFRKNCYSKNFLSKSSDYWLPAGIVNRSAHPPVEGVDRRSLFSSQLDWILGMRFCSRSAWAAEMEYAFFRAY